jgi:hypothetical protein
MGGGFHQPGGVGASAGGEGRGEFAGRPGGFEGGGFHAHPGFDSYRATLAMRVNIDNPASGVQVKPQVTALGIDPENEELWASISDTLAHFDRNGNLLQIFYLVLTDGQSLKPTSIVVEPNRLLIAADPWGVYEFPRPDKRPAAAPSPAAATPQNSLVPELISPAPQPPPTPSR